VTPLRDRKVKDQVQGRQLKDLPSRRFEIYKKTDGTLRGRYLSAVRLTVEL